MFRIVATLMLAAMLAILLPGATGAVHAACESASAVTGAGGVSRCDNDAEVGVDEITVQVSASGLATRQSNGAGFILADLPDLAEPPETH